MDPLKKRKFDENGIAKAEPDTFVPLLLNPDDARKILDPFTHEQLLQIVQSAFLRHPDVLEAVRLIADRDVTQRKLFVRGLGWETTTEKLQSLFASYGELEEAVVILDKVTGKSKGYGFVTFRHVDGALMALKEPSKKIDGRVTVTQLAAAGVSGGSGGAGTGSGGGGLNNPVDVSMRKIYVANVPYDMPAEKILQRFSMYGEIEEGPLGFDKATGKSKGFALFVYKTAEAARASLVDPIKNIDGHQLNCKLAIDGKRGKPPPTLGTAGPIGVQGGSQGNGDGIGSAVPGAPYGGPGGIGGPYGGFSGSLGAGVGVGAGGPGLPAIGNQSAGGGFNSGIGGPYSGSSHFGGHGGTGYGGLGGAGSGLVGAAGLGGGFGAGLSAAGGGSGGVPSGLGPAGRGTSLYGLPPSSAGMGSGDYPGSAHYSLSSGGYQGQHNQGAAQAPRIPPGGAYQGMPPYY